jgi:hypothetical protein
MAAFAPRSDIIRPVDAEVAGEQEDLLLIAAQPGTEPVAGVVPVVPVPQPVVDDPCLHGGVVAFPQVIEELRVQAGVAAGAGLLDGVVRLVEDGDDVPGPRTGARQGRVSSRRGMCGSRAQHCWMPASRNRRCWYPV